MVHRRATAEVFLTDVRPASPTEWLCAVQFPRGHVLIDRRRPHLPVPLAIEAIRQMGLFIAHSGYSIPKSWAFTLQHATFRWCDDGAPALPEFGPLELVASLRVTHEHHRKGEISGLEVIVDFTSQGRPVATGGGALRCISPVHYQALRRRAPNPHDVPRRYDPAPLADVRRDGRAVEAVLGYDHSNPFFFDHPVDHLPGMLILHAMTDLFSSTLPDAELMEIDLVCHTFPEFDPPVRIEGVVDSSTETVRLTFTQGRTVVAEGISSGRVALEAARVTEDEAAEDDGPVAEGTAL